jgi:bifunctional isochorismate lyase / aryl carrier protein
MIIKENYLTESSIKNLLDICDSYSNNKSRFNICPSDSALLIMDMQDYFISKKSHAYIPEAENIISNINSLINLFRKNNSLIIFTQHYNNETKIDSMQINWWRSILKLDDPFALICEKLNYDNDFVVKKENYNAFKDTELQIILTKKKIKQIVITGVMTHLCCDTTARDAFMNNFVVYFIVDSTATYNLQMHFSSITNLSHGFVIPYTTSEYMNRYIHAL